MTHRPDHLEEEDPLKAAEPEPVKDEGAELTAVEEPLNPEAPPEGEQYVGLDTWQAARRRRIPLAQVVGIESAVWDDAVSSAKTFAIMAPYDWVIGTPLRFCWSPFWTDIAGANQRQLDWSSRIEAWVMNRNVNTGNANAVQLEAVTNLLTQMYRDEARYIERLIDATVIESAFAGTAGPAGRDFMWTFRWRITRNGASANDTIDASITTVGPPTLDYFSTYDYQHIPTE